MAFDHKEFHRTLENILIPRCQYCLHPIASHHGDDGCTSISSRHEDGDGFPLPCGCGKMDDVPLKEKVPLEGICARCGAMLHESDHTLCELCRGHKGEPWPEGDE